MKLYCEKLDIKTKYELLGTIKSSAKFNIWIRFHAIRTGKMTFQLDLYCRKNGEHIIVPLAEDYDCRMKANDILFYVEQRIDKIWKIIGE